MPGRCPADARPMSADDHVIEPPHLWVDRVPAKFREACPHIVEVDGRQAWLYEDELTHIAMRSCRALPGFKEEGYPPAPGTVERLKDMDLDGVWGQLCFPNYARFAGHRFFLNVKDLELGLACLRTYNDYLLAEWCATDPNRLYGAAILPLQDINLGLRGAERGSRAQSRCGARITDGPLRTDACRRLDGRRRSVRGRFALDN